MQVTLRPSCSRNSAKFEFGWSRFGLRRPSVACNANFQPRTNHPPPCLSPKKKLSRASKRKNNSGRNPRTGIPKNLEQNEPRKEGVKPYEEEESAEDGGPFFDGPDLALQRREDEARERNTEIMAKWGDRGRGPIPGLCDSTAPASTEGNSKSFSRLTLEPPNESPKRPDKSTQPKKPAPGSTLQNSKSMNRSKPPSGFIGKTDANAVTLSAEGSSAISTPHFRKRADEINGSTRSQEGEGAIRVLGSEAGVVPAVESRVEANTGLRWKSTHDLEIVPEGSGFMEHLQDLYLILIRSPPLQFATAVVAAPFICATLFAPLYFIDLDGVTVDDSALTNFRPRQSTSAIPKSSGDRSSLTNDDLNTPPANEELISQSSSSPPVANSRVSLAEAGEGPSDPRVWLEVFGFCLSLQTGLEQKLYPTSWFAVGLANVNALAAQLLVVFMTGAVFSRLSQPSTPIKCSSIAIVTPPVLCPPSDEASPLKSSFGKCPKPQNTPPVPETEYRILVLRYILTGPQPTELVDVRMELSFMEDTITPFGSNFRRVTNLQLVRGEAAYLKYGMTVRHVIDESSPLFGRSHDDLLHCNAEFSLSVLGLERSSMQPVFHIQRYHVSEGHVLCNAQFEDVVRMEGNVRKMDHSKLNSWRRA